MRGCPGPPTHRCAEPAVLTPARENTQVLLHVGPQLRRRADGWALGLSHHSSRTSSLPPMGKRRDHLSLNPPVCQREEGNVHERLSQEPSSDDRTQVPGD